LYELRSATLRPTSPKPFAQQTPFGKVPAIEDGGVVMFESGAILEYVLERYGDGRLAPPRDSPQWGPFLQWVHFAETAFQGLGNMAWHVMSRQDADQLPQAIADYRTWATASLDTLESALAGKDFILGADFTGADIMLGYTLLVAKSFGVLGTEHPRVERYFERLSSRPAYKTAFAAGVEAR
jgi:glutathione S-transferase